MSDYFRPLLQTGPARPDGALTLAGGWCWFTHAEHLRRDAAPAVIPAQAVPAPVQARLCAPRAPLCGMTLTTPRLMGILNVTPDSFSDGGHFADQAVAVAQAHAMAQDCDILDIGGESTRPGATLIPDAEEIARTAPVIAALRKAGLTTTLSIDTRKSAVAQAALAAGADLVNDVSAFTHDPALGPLSAAAGVPVCLMHTQGTPQTMQVDPRYDDVLLDVYDALAARLAHAIALGIAPSQIVLDPGLGFGKTQAHNLALLHRLSLFHALGCPVLLGASRKKFVGTIGNSPDAVQRMPGSLAVALHGAAQGVQILRVHDTSPTRQGLRLWQALTPNA